MGARPAVAALLAAALWHGLAAAAAPAADAAAELDAVVRELNALERWIGAAGERLAVRRRELVAADRRISEAGARARALAGRVADGRVRLAELDASRQRLQAQRRVHAEHIAGHLRTAWRTGGRDPIKQLLDREDPLAAERAARYRGYLAKAQARAVASLERALGELAAVEAQIAERQRMHATAQRALDAERAALAAERGRRQAHIRTLARELDARERDRDDLAADRQRLSRLLEELRRAARRTAAPAAGGRWPWPVEGRIVHRFGAPRAGGRMRWQGVYFSAPPGSPVRAVADGTVVFADWLRGFGMLAIVDHGAGRLSLYGHADALHKRAGESVAGGEVLATAGRSGGQREVGLYFETRQDGEPADPLRWLRAR